MGLNSSTHILFYEYNLNRPLGAVMVAAVRGLFFLPQTMMRED
jgi:hypothetical protein